jgi:hypothetical protein
VAVHAHVVPEIAQYVALRPSGHEQARSELHREPRLLAGQADPLELPGALAGARRPQGGHAIPRDGSRQELEVAQVRGGRQHVQLEPETQPRPEADRLERHRQPAQRRKGLDVPQRALGARALHVTPHQQQRLPGGRHEQVRVLSRAGEIHEICGLHDQRRVQAIALQARLKCGDAACDLVGRRRRREHGRRR